VTVSRRYEAYIRPFNSAKRRTLRGTSKKKRRESAPLEPGNNGEKGGLTMRKKAPRYSKGARETESMIR